MSKNRHIPETVDLHRFYVEAPKEGGVPVSARVAPDVKEAIGRILGMGIAWKKESDFLRSAVRLLLDECAPLFVHGKDSVAEDIRVMRIHTDRAQRLARRYDHDKFIHSTMDVVLKCLANRLSEEAVDELRRSQLEARSLHPTLEKRLIARVETEPKLADVWAEVQKRDAHRIKSEEKVACECGHLGKIHNAAKLKDGTVWPGCEAKGCPCEEFEHQDAGPDGDDE